jgi:hypothetical protein
MRHLATFVFALAALFFSYGCPNPAPHPIKFGLGKPFTLQAGQAAECAEVEGFIIALGGVLNDSRCPMGVECITAGKADIAIVLSNGGVQNKVNLSFTRPDGAESATVFEGYDVRVIGVMPFREQNKTIKPEEYSISFEVTPQSVKE